MKKILISILVIILGTSTIILSRNPRVRGLFLSKKHFIISELDERVRYEPLAEQYANDIAESLSFAIEKVEQEQLYSFKKSFKVFVFSTQESYNKHFGDPPGSLSRGGSLFGNVYITPRAFNFEGLDTHQETLVHELSHLHLTQALGISSIFGNIPFWFGEGLADNVANTGGEFVSDSMAINAFQIGNSFIPDEKGRFLVSIPDWGRRWPMFKKQSKMFVRYLQINYPESFRNLLIAIYDGDSFSKSFSELFGKNVMEMWQEFVGNITIQRKHGL